MPSQACRPAFLPSCETRLLSSERYFSWGSEPETTERMMASAPESPILKAAGRKFTPELKAYTQGDGMPSYDTIRQ